MEKRSRRTTARELHEIKLAIDRQSRSISKWLSILVQVIAAQAEPDDPRIAAATAEMKRSNDELQQAIDDAHPR